MEIKIIYSVDIFLVPSGYHSKKKGFIKNSAGILKTKWPPPKMETASCQQGSYYAL
jgi:hypothetical protein